MTTSAKFQAILLTLLVTAFFTSASVASTNVTVMTYNVDERTDFGAIVAVLTNGGDFVTAVDQTIAEVQRSNRGLRAHLIAAEIAKAQPDLVGLQEAAVWKFGDQTLDLLQTILEDLAGQYTAVISVPEFQINIAQLGIGFTDRDVILARTGSALEIIGQPRYGYYRALVPLPAFPPYLPTTSSITRGWAYVDVLLNGTAFRFITTHLEDGTNTTSPIFALVQALQEVQLVYSPALTFLPVIIAGDFNTIANNPSSPTFLTYRFMLANGFTDAWRTAHPGTGGATCCQDDLQSSTPQLTQRLDQVFTRGRISVVGAQLVDDYFMPPGSWPSDHAAVESELRVGPVL
jgi:endonuclease/exonuclease/phosphatase family metal-dependent hydrolase